MLEALLKNKASHPASPWLDAIREQAQLKAQELGLPTRKTEDWKYTSILPISQHRFSTPNIGQALSHKPQALSDIDNAIHIYMSNNYISVSTDNLPCGLTIKPLMQAVNDEPELRNTLNQSEAQHSTNVFTQINTALMHSGIYINVEDNSQIEQPIIVHHINQQANTTAHIRNLICIGEKSSACIIEHYTGQTDDYYFTNTVSEYYLKDHSLLNAIKLVNENDKASHIGNVFTEASAYSTLNHHQFTLGGQLVRSDVNANINGEHVTINCHGLFKGIQNQHIDHHLAINHLMPHGKSTQNYRGILDDHAQAVFNGSVYVAPDAQHTNSYQSNKNILLSNNALVNSKPELRIYADDVKCAHGSTTGQLDADALFYCQTRGLSAKQANQLLLHAFANEIIEQLPLTVLIQFVNQHLWMQGEQS